MEKAEGFAFEMWNRPEDAGVSSRGILRFLEAWEGERDRVQFHSLILLRHGKVVCRMRFSPYDDQTPHELYSLSKSFTSAAAGFAVAEGKLKWSDSVVDILPEEVPAGREAELKQLTVETLLSMGSGLDPASDCPSPRKDVTWASHVLSHKVLYPAMTHFHYNTFGTYLVSCMVQKAVGETVRDYLMPRLFAPLGIEKPAWDLSPEGVCCGGFGLHLNAEGIARFGQCLLQKGMWRGKRILPQGWVELATREHIANYEGERREGDEWGQGYGFQFWRCMGGRYRGDGAFGQVCMVDEKRDAVLAATAGNHDMSEEFRLAREYLFSAFDAGAGTQEEQARLQAKIASLAYAFPGDDGSEMPGFEGLFVAEYEGMESRLEFGKGPFHQIALRYQPGGVDNTLRGGGLELYIPLGRPSLAGMAKRQESVNRYFGSCGWQDGALMVAVRSVDGPATIEGAFRWTEAGLTFDGTGIHFPNGHVEFARRG